MKVQLLPGTAGVYAFYCPGCGKKHTVFTKDEGLKHPIWGFNGDMDKPTFTPSVCAISTSPDGEIRCHSFIRDGKIEYLQDSSHTLAGKTVEMIDLEDGNEETNP